MAVLVTTLALLLLINLDKFGFGFEALYNSVGVAQWISSSACGQKL